MNTTHPSHLVNCELDNALVAQKEMVISAIRMGNYNTVITMLQVCTPVWCASSYSYKGVELCDRLLQTISTEMGVCMEPRTRSRRANLELWARQAQDIRVTFDDHRNRYAI